MTALMPVISLHVFDLPLHLVSVILYIACVCYISLMHILIRMSMGQACMHLPIWAPYTHMGCPYMYGIDLLNFKFIRDLACPWIKEHLS